MGQRKSHKSNYKYFIEIFEEKWKHIIRKLMGYLESSAQREIHCSKKAHIKTEDFKSITSLYTSES